MSKKILVLSSTFPRFIGDTEPPFVFELSRRLALNHQVSVLVPHAPGLAQQEVMAGMQVVRFRYAPESWQRLAYNGGILPRLKQNPAYYLLLPAFVLGQAWALSRLLKREKFDLIHAHWLLPQGLIAAWVAPTIPLVVTSHGGDLYGLRGKLLDRLKIWVMNKARGLTVVSQAMAQYLSSKIQPEKLRVISMGVDLQSTFIVKPDTERQAASLLFVGRLVEKKGLRYLLQALAQVKQQIPLVKLQIIGDGPERESLQSLAQQLALTDHIQWLGKIPNTELPAYYQRAQIFVMPSVIDARGDQEGLGLVAVEAMGCGCAVIASDLPAIRDVVMDGVTGLSVPPANVEALAQGISQLLSDPKLRQFLSEQALIHVKNQFDWDVITQKYQEFLSESARKL